MIYKVEVWITLLSGQHLAGEMVCDIADNGRGQGAFRYSQEYLNLSGAFALDPISLPLKSGNFETNRSAGIFGVFEDSLPDDWGRRLLIRKNKIPGQQQNPPTLLLALGNSGLGALAYTNTGQPAPRMQDISVIHLEQLVHEAERLEHGETRDSELSLLFSAGSSPGGARPKALVYDINRQKHFLAKFPSTKDYVDVVRIEAATMSLAAKAGLTVPCCELVKCGNRYVLLVERFDIHPAGRRHMISLQTLLKMEGYYVCRYFDLLEIIRKTSAVPEIDTELLFRQMVFNAVIGNTDDHLKNFWMVCDENGWRLSPAFDLIPDIRQSGEHILRFDYDSYYPGREKLLKLGRSWGISQTRTIVEEVYDALSGWKDVFAEFGVENDDVMRYKEIDKRFKRLCGGSADATHHINS